MNSAVSIGIVTIVLGQLLLLVTLNVLLSGAGLHYTALNS